MTSTTGAIPQSSTGKPDTRIAVAALAAILVLAPIVVLDLSSWKSNGSLWYLGMLPALMGLFAGRRLAFAAAALTPVIVGISLLLRDLPPVVGAAYMLLLGVATGLSARRGWHVMMSFAAPLAALALIGDMHVALPSGRYSADASPESILMAMVVLLIGGVWTATFGAFAINKVHVTPPEAVPNRTSLYFAAAMGGLVALTSFIALTWLPPNSWWIVLTMYVVVQPYYASAITRVSQRVVGTLVGSTAAAVVVVAFHHLPGLIAALAAVLTILAAWANLRLPYWVFVTFLTPAVVLQTAGGTHDVAQAIADRALYTLVGSGLAIVVMAGGHKYLIRHPRPQET
ncbi:FUSC family protein [Dietzia aurantiaca]|uniref:FUSC family protein n=1 Tax=Dietzia aurantiaca TaxID=983873 RepID=UPI001E4C9F61|nr:FUSC family protein [Dietzia aurantiaca]MCD2264117.1 FUSC family protein [Dietzia aurantiaca]